MRKHLYFVCPTDHLEVVINNLFHQENYYLTSLGNSVTFNPGLVEEINSLIETKCITEITFVLSDNNQMIMDALKNQRFNKVKGLKRFYNAITRQKNCEEGVRQIVDIRIPIISYYLNLKIRELKLQLNNGLSDTVNVNAKIYTKHNHTFNKIPTNLLYLEHFRLN